MGIKPLSGCQPMLASSSMTARDVARGLNPIRAIVACSVLLGRCPARQCKPEAVSSNFLGASVRRPALERVTSREYTQKTAIQLSLPLRALFGLPYLAKGPEGRFYHSMEPTHFGPAEQSSAHSIGSGKGGDRVTCHCPPGKEILC